MSTRSAIASAAARSSQPLISLQWFIRMEELAAPAIAAAKDGSVQFVPERFKGVYLNWMENIRDWRISRQLWWGHRIPVWYRQSDGQPIVSEVDIDVDPETGEPVEQDPDVLDTWFSSGLWPFSTLGWPDETEDLQALLPILGHGDRLRDPLLLGRADGLLRHRDDGRAAVPHGLPARHRARCRGAQDEQDQGQRARPDRDHG